MAALTSVQGTTTTGLSNAARKDLFAVKCQEAVLPFGKHKVKLLSQVDEGSIRQPEQWGRLPTKGLQERNFQPKVGKKIINVQVLLADLKACTRTKDLQRGRQVHAKAVECGHESDIYVLSALVRMYAKCGRIVDAHRVFDSIRNPNVVCWNALLLGYAENGEGHAALDLLSSMKASGCAPDSVTYVAAVKACTSLAVDGHESGKKICLERGREIHLEIGSNMDGYVQSTLIDMYAKCGCMAEARHVFNSLQRHDVVAWNVLLLGYALNGEGLVALDLFSRMKASGCACDSATYVSVLKACTSLAVDGDGSVKMDCLERGRVIHSEIGGNLSYYVQSTLVNMYAKCGSMLEARRVFDSIQKPNVVCWNALILGYAENGKGLLALDLFYRMKASCAPSSVTYVAALKACTFLALDGNGSGNENCLEQGRKIHLEIVSHMDHYVQSALIDMYAKCGSMVEARHAFNSMEKPDTVSWTALLLGYAENGGGLVALELFSTMKTSGCAPNSVTYVAVLKACTSIAVDGDPIGRKNCLQRGRAIHLDVGSNLDHYVQNTLIDMYAKCGSIVDARRVFDSVQKPDVVCWNALLLGYVEHGEGPVALDLFSSMKARGSARNSLTWVAALKACTSLAVDGDCSGKKNGLEMGREIHAEAGSNLDRYVENTLLDMYGKCGSMVEAQKVFDNIEKPDVVSWTTLLLGYADNGMGFVALDLFSRMKASGCTPDSVTYVAALKACRSLAFGGDKRSCLQWGREIHLKIGSNLDSYIQITLMDMYAKCGSMVDAHCVFDRIPKPDVVAWNALLRGYAENGEGLLVLDLFSVMNASACAPNHLTYVAALKACGLVGALGLGRKLHSEITEFSTDVVTCLVDFYGKCGSMTEAHRVFDLHPKARETATWNALLAGYGCSANSDPVFNLFEAMQDEGFRPDAVTFVCILSCCSHAGLVNKAREYFEGMELRYGVTPIVMHYNCMVDGLGRANLLNEALVLLQKMPCKSDAVTWMTLLGACRKWRNVQIGRMAFQCLMGKNEEAAPAHVLMAHIYGFKCMWQEQAGTSLCLNKKKLGETTQKQEMFPRVPSLHFNLAALKL